MSTVKLGGTDHPDTQSVAPPAEPAPVDAAPIDGAPAEAAPAEPGQQESEQTIVGAVPPEIDPRDTSGPQLRDPERYHILGEHGRGGLGRVSRAHDRELGRDVAIKELISRGQVDEIRFLREALITARLEHPGIVPVHEAGRWPDGTPFYAMKLVAGRSLRDLIAERTTVEQRIGLLHHVIAIADAIAYAHGRNIIHRDLKPGNVIVGDFGETIVIDWGLAKDITTPDESGGGGNMGSPDRRSSDDDLTAAGSVLGTPAYMSPEQKRGEQVDQRADVFAIGAMLWELCSPRKALPTSAAQRHRILRRVGIDQDMVAIIDKALAPEPAQRYPHAGALAADLKAFKSGARIAARHYSLLAMLAHWTRRHRALALSVTAAILLATSGIVIYVRNIAVERDRADVAAQTAQRERDRARLSEASALLEKDPTRAKEVLASLQLHSPQHALLTARAEQLAAARVIAIPSVIDGIYRAPGAATVEIVTRDGNLHRLDPATGVIAMHDQELTGPVAHRGSDWLYSRRSGDSGAIRITSSSSAGALDVELPNGVSRLVALSTAAYALDAAGDLYRIDGKTATVVDHLVNSIAGDGDVRMTCKLGGELEVVRKDKVVLRERCAAIKNPAGLVVVRDDFAALTADHVLTAVRRGERVDIPTAIEGEYELDMSGDGVVVIADYGTRGTSWFVRPGSATLEPGPAYPSTPYSVAADGNLAAWGYVDGAAIVLDTLSGTVWTLRGHSGAVGRIIVDAANSRVVAATSRELRVWELKRPTHSLVTALPCTIFRIERSSDGRRAAVDCSDGGVRVLSRDTGSLAYAHAHVGPSVGVQWLDGLVCSAGFRDGQVLCSMPDGSALHAVGSGLNRITWLIGPPDQHSLIFASSDGRIWRYSDKLEELYRQSSVYRGAVSPDGRLLASCAFDGTLAVYDLENHRLLAHLPDHAGPSYVVVWIDDELWTSGDDGVIKRWVVRDREVVLRASLPAPGSVHLMKSAHGGWAANAGDNTLLIGRNGLSIALRVDIGKPISSLDVSPDMRYVAASVDGEIVVVDFEHSAIATMTTGRPDVRQLSFLDATSLAFSEIAALKIMDVEHLDYVRFRAAAEPSGEAVP